MRDIPIIIFINKLDREGKDAFTLLDEIEQKLKLKVTPLSFPIGIGYDFKGVFNIWNNNIQIFKILSKQKIADNQIFNSISDNKLVELISKKNHEQLIDNLELIKGIYPNFNETDYLNGILQPVFFGSALNNFGIKELLDCFIKIAPYPQPKNSETRTIKPSEIDFSGFVFKNSCKYGS